MDQIKGFINTIGALAEATALFRLTLLKNGVPESEVQAYVCQFIDTIFRLSMRSNEPEN